MLQVIDQNGFTMPTIDEIYQRKLKDFKTVKPDMRETDSNIIVSYLRFDAAEEYDTLLKELQAFNQLSVLTATGLALNAITSRVNMTWLPAKKAVGTIKVVADIGTEIPQAWGVETKSGVKFVTLNQESIFTTQEETDVEVIALVAGKNGNVSVDEIVKQTNTISGVQEITNERATLGGQEKETDTELRERYLRYIEQPASFSTTGIKNFILRNTNVKKCQVIENETDLPNRQGIPAHSYEPICLGDTNKNILEKLYKYKIAGIRTHGDITKDFGDITVGFSRPTEKKVYFDIVVRAVKGVWNKDYEQIIKDIILNYVGTLEPQGTIYLYKILGEVYKQTQGITSIGIRIGDIPGVTIENDYQLGAKEIAIILDENIKINTVVI